MKLDLIAIIEARTKLERMVERKRNSFETQDFARRRAAMLRHTRRRQIAAT